MSIFWILIFCLFSFSGAAQNASNIKDLDLPSRISSSSPYYTLEGFEPASEPGFLKFGVTAPHAVYEVEGLVYLEKLLHEIEVIERIKQDDAGSGFVDGAMDSVKDTGSGFVNLVAHPVGSAKGIGKAAGKLGKGVGGMFRKKEEGEKSSFGEKMLGSSEREIAKKLGVDVYTENPYLKQLIQSMAKARLGGKGAAAVTKFLLPVAGLASVALTASGVNSAADQFVDDTSRKDLFQLNAKALAAIGFSEDEAKSIVNLPYYSPRESTYLRFYLEALSSVEGFKQLGLQAAQAKSLWEARKILLAAKIAVQEKASGGASYKRLELSDEGLALEPEAGNKVILVTSYDVLNRSGLGDRVMDRVRDLRERWGKGEVEIWNLGKIALDFRTVALTNGIKTREWMAFDREEEG